MYDNVLIMHDGQNLFDPNTVFLNDIFFAQSLQAFMGNAWMCQDTVNENVFKGNMDEVP